MKESVTKFDFDAAFKALDEIEIPKVGGVRPNRTNLNEAVKRADRTSTLIEEYYDVQNPEDLEKAQETVDADIAKAKLARIEKIVDLDAKTEEDIQPSYVGKVIIQCPQCMTLFYKKPEDIERSDESDEFVNIGEECQHCGNTAGYTVIGKVAEEFLDEEPAEEEVAEEEVVEEEPAEETVEETEEEVEEIPEEGEELPAIEETEEGEEVKESLQEDVELTEDVASSMPVKILPAAQIKDFLKNIPPVNADDKRPPRFFKLGYIKELSSEIASKYKGGRGSAGEPKVRIFKCIEYSSLYTGFSWYNTNDTKAADKVLGTARHTGEKTGFQHSADVEFKNKIGVYPDGSEAVQAYITEGSKKKVRYYISLDDADLQQADKNTIAQYLTPAAANKLLNPAPKAPAGVDANGNPVKDKDINRFKITGIYMIGNLGSSLIESFEGKDGSEELDECDIKEDTKAAKRLEKAAMELESLSIREKRLARHQQIRESRRSQGAFKVTKADIDNLFNNPAFDAIKEELDDEKLDIDVVDEIDEESLDNIISEYLEENYSNVKSYSTNSCRFNGKNLIVEGLITFKSGKTKKTSFVFENKFNRLIGSNKSLAEGLSFSLKYVVDRKKVFFENLYYRYNAGKKLVEGFSGKKQRLNETSPDYSHRHDLYILKGITPDGYPRYVLFSDNSGQPILDSRQRYSLDRLVAFKTKEEAQAFLDNFAAVQPKVNEYRMHPSFWNEGSFKYDASDFAVETDTKYGKCYSLMFTSPDADNGYMRKRNFDIDAARAAYDQQLRK